MPACLKLLAVVALVVAVQAAWLVRWQLIQPDKAIAYELDRWTGSVYFVTYRTREKIQDK